MGSLRSSVHAVALIATFIILAVGGSAAFWYFISRPATRDGWVAELSLVSTVVGFGVAVLALLFAAAQIGRATSRPRIALEWGDHMSVEISDHFDEVMTKGMKSQRMVLRNEGPDVQVHRLTVLTAVMVTPSEGGRSTAFDAFDVGPTEGEHWMGRRQAQLGYLLDLHRPGHARIERSDLPCRRRVRSIAKPRSTCAGYRACARPVCGRGGYVGLPLSRPDGPGHRHA